MPGHNWKSYRFADNTMRGWHCTGCNQFFHGNSAALPLTECPGKRPWSAAEASLDVCVFEKLGWKLPEGFWETQGGQALKAILDTGGKAG